MTDPGSSVGDLRRMGSPNDTLASARGRPPTPVFPRPRTDVHETHMGAIPRLAVSRALALGSGRADAFGRRGRGATVSHDPAHLDKQIVGITRLGAHACHPQPLELRVSIR